MSVGIICLTYFSAPQLAGILTALAVVTIVVYAVLSHKCVKGYCKLYKTHDVAYVREERKVASPAEEPVREQKSKKRKK